MFKYFFFCLNLLVLAITQLTAQNFVNGEMGGEAITVGAGIGMVPDGWQNVPFTDPNCRASRSGLDSPDVTDLDGPGDTLSGILGDPYSDTTFLSGLLSDNGLGSIFHEGIQQRVGGFVVGETYIVGFYQANVKQRDQLDTSGAWMVIVDNTIIDTTASTVSFEPFNSTSFTWERREVSFVAAADTHTIKFLPADDDTYIRAAGRFDRVGGALRMGIDSAYLIPCSNVVAINLGEDMTLCTGDSLELNASHFHAISYLWQDNSTEPELIVVNEGTYRVQVTTPCGTTSDTINVTIDNDLCQVILTLPNVFTPNQDNENDQFIPIDSEGIESMQTTIYNRWGAEVFSTNNPLIEWDGKTNSGTDAVEGTYFWVITHTDRSGNTGEKKGVVTLFR